MFTRGGSLWVSWVNANLLRGRLFWDNSLQASGSWIWKRLLKLRPIARPFLDCHLGSGSTARFWHDNWTGLGPLIDLAGANGPRVSGIHRLATVAEAEANGSWHLPRGRHSILLLLRAALPSQPGLVPACSDEFKWLNTTNNSPGIFSASTTWDCLHPPGHSVTWHDSVWFPQRIPKHAFIHWLVARDRLTTRDRLRSWGLQVPSECLLCDAGQ